MDALEFDTSFNFDIGVEGSAVPRGTDVLNRAAFRGGKLLRPRLLVSMGGCFELPLERTRAYAVAAERIHNATLLHDDVIDESALRRGQPTLSAGGHNRRAVIAGDLLLARALRDLGEQLVPERHEVIRDLFGVLADLSEGEWLQLEARGCLSVDERHLREVARKKTSSLMGWCCAVPGRLLNLDLPTTEALRKIGTHLGTAFQMLDDVVDFSSKSGKPYAQDLIEGQVNFVVAHILSTSPSLSDEIAGYLWKGIPESASPAFLAATKLARVAVRQKANIEIESARRLVEIAGLASNVQSQIHAHVIKPFVQYSESNLKGEA
jgi:octaprenyl-diphosphate synthase